MEVEQSQSKYIGRGCKMTLCSAIPSSLSTPSPHIIHEFIHSRKSADKLLTTYSSFESGEKLLDSSTGQCGLHSEAVPVAGFLGTEVGDPVSLLDSPTGWLTQNLVKV